MKLLRFNPSSVSFLAISNYHAIITFYGPSAISKILLLHALPGAVVDIARAACILLL